MTKTSSTLLPPIVNFAECVGIVTTMVMDNVNNTFKIYLLRKIANSRFAPNPKPYDRKQIFVYGTRVGEWTELRSPPQKSHVYTTVVNKEMIYTNFEVNVFNRKRSDFKLMYIDISRNVWSNVCIELPEHAVATRFVMSCNDQVYIVADESLSCSNSRGGWESFKISIWKSNIPINVTQLMSYVHGHNNRFKNKDS